MYLWSLIFLLLSSCNTQESSISSQWQTMNGRDDFPQTHSNRRFPVYRLRVPERWVRIDPDANASLFDTMKPICTFSLQEEGKEIRITIHNFPSNNIEERVPPMAQIARWKRQFEQLELSSVLTTPQAFSGFSGVVFEGRGLLKGEKTGMIGWIMQLAPEHYRALSYPRTAEEQQLFRQMRADYTFKVVGDPHLIDQHKQELIAAARSFELIHDIPGD